MAKRKKLNIEDLKLKSFKKLKKGLVELEKRFEEITSDRKDSGTDNTYVSH